MDVGSVVVWKRKQYRIIARIYVHSTKSYYFKLREMKTEPSYRIVRERDLLEQATIDSYSRQYHTAKLTCTCGATATYGEVEAMGLHAEYCDCFIKKGS